MHSWGPNASFDTHIDIHTHGVCQSTIHVKYVIYDTFDIYDIHDIWHMTCINMSIWVSKEALGPQEYSQPSYIFYKIVFRAKNWNILIPHFSFVFFRISFVYFMVLEQSGFAAWDKTKEIFSLQYTIGLRKDRKHTFFWTFWNLGHPRFRV